MKYHYTTRGERNWAGSEEGVESDSAVGQIGTCRRAGPTACPPFSASGAGFFVGAFSAATARGSRSTAGWLLAILAFVLALAGALTLATVLLALVLALPQALTLASVLLLTLALALILAAALA